MDIIKKLQKKQNFNQSEKELADYILKNKEKILNMSVQELSKKTFTSTSTIFRLCKKIGLSGYQQFKIEFSADLQKKYEKLTNINANFPFTDNDSFAEISKRIYELESESLEQTVNLMSNKILENVVNLIINSKKVGVFASGDTFTEALSFQNRMMKINKNIILPLLPYEETQLALTFNSNDCAIVISYSGENKEMLLSTELLKKNNSKIISICSKEKSHLGKISDIVILLPRKESQSIKFSTFSSQTEIEFVLSVIYSCLFVSNYEKHKKLRIKAETALLDTRF